jgi:hypothetical protein
MQFTLAEAFIGATRSRLETATAGPKADRPLSALSAPPLPGKVSFQEVGHIQVVVVVEGDRARWPGGWVLRLLGSGR